MLNKRHLETIERAVICKIVNEAGAVEVIRLLATLVANDHPDIATGGKYRSQLMRIARAIDSEPEPSTAEQSP